MQKILIGLGVPLIIIGLLWPLILKSGLGRLPGDIAVDKENVRFYFPIMSSLIISILLSLLIWLFMRK